MQSALGTGSPITLQKTWEEIAGKMEAAEHNISNSNYENDVIAHSFEPTRRLQTIQKR